MSTFSVEFSALSACRGSCSTLITETVEASACAVNENLCLSDPLASAGVRLLSLLLENSEFILTLKSCQLLVGWSYLFMQNEKHDPSRSCISCMTWTWHLQNHIPPRTGQESPGHWLGTAALSSLTDLLSMSWSDCMTQEWRGRLKRRPDHPCVCGVLRALGTFWRVYLAADNTGLIWKPQGRSEWQ